MKLEITPLRDRLHVKVMEKRLDAVVATAFKDRVRESISAAGGSVLVDLRHVDFMDSSGLGAMISVFKGMPPGRELELTGLTPNVERVLRLTRMDSVFTIRPEIGTNPEGDLP